MKCKQCGQELSDNIRFCTNCGSPVEYPQPPNAPLVDDDVLLVTTPSIPNYKIVSLYGAAVASCIRIAAKRSGMFEVIDALSGNLGDDSFLSSIEEECYLRASKRLMNVVRNLNCNAVVGLRYNSVYSDEVIHVTAYGTACVVEKNV